MDILQITLLFTKYRISEEVQNCHIIITSHHHARQAKCGCATNQLGLSQKMGVACIDAIV